MNAAHKNILLFSGALLFLIGLAGGALVHVFVNPRMGLSAHLAAVQGAIFLLVLGAVWSQLRFPGVRWHGIACWSALYGMYAFWFSLTLAAAWGTSQATPIAGAGYESVPWKESTVLIALYSASIASLLGASLVVVGSWRALLGSRSEAPLQNISDS